MARMENYPFVSIIIPTVRANEILERCLESLAAQDYPKDKFEVILISLNVLSIQAKENVRIISGVEYPNSRNAGAKLSKGEILAFVDDDCVIPVDWLARATPYFKDPRVGVIGGPALPFKEAPLRYRVGGYLFASAFTSGFASCRYRILPKPYEGGEQSLLTANTLVRKTAFDSVSGFDSSQVMSEENDLFFRMKQKGYTLLHVPEIFVWHPARPIFMPLVKRVLFYAVGRGMLMQRKPRTIKPMYAAPTLFVIAGAALLVASLFSSKALALFLIFSAVYLFANLLNALWVFFSLEKRLFVALLAFLATPCVHASYGIGVLYGLFLAFSGNTRKGRKLWRSE